MKIFIFLFFLNNIFGQKLTPFHNGEILDYEVKLNFITVGSAKMSIKKITSEHKYLDYYYYFNLKTNKIWDQIYPIRDTVRTWIDSKNFYTHKMYKTIIEPNYKKKIKVVFNYDKKFFISNNNKINISKKIRDPYSFFYYLRTLNLKVGNEFKFDIFDDNKISSVEFSVLKLEEVDTLIGKFQCLVIEPVDIKKNKSIMKIWLTNDENKIPIKIVSNTNFGSLNMLIVNKN